MLSSRNGRPLLFSGDDGCVLARYKERRDLDNNVSVTLGRVYSKMRGRGSALLALSPWVRDSAKILDSSIPKDALQGT